MRKVVVLLAGAAALFALSSSANAATVTALGPASDFNILTSDPNAVADGIGASSANFNNPPLVSTTTYGSSTPAQGPFSQGGASFSGDGILMKNPGQDSLGLYAEPFHDNTQYLTVRPFGANETVTFGGTFGKLGLYWGSMDTYNSIGFYKGGILVDTVTGAQAAAAALDRAGPQGDDVNNRYIIIGGIVGGFDTIVLTSTQNSFEIDNLAWGPSPDTNPTPLPGALPLLVSGISGLGLMMGWRRKRRNARATA